MAEVDELAALEAEFVELTSPRAGETASDAEQMGLMQVGQAAPGQGAANVDASGDELENLQAQLANEVLEPPLEQPQMPGAGVEPAVDDGLDGLEAEFIELTSPRAEQIDVEAAFAAMMAGSAAAQTDGGLVFVRDPTSTDLEPALQPMDVAEASDSDEMVGSGTDSARSTSQESEGQTTSQEQAVAKSVSGIDQHGQQFRVQADGLPATVTVHYDHICLEYLSSPTRLSASDTEEAKKREVSFATMRSWRSNANSVEIELGESESLLMTCDGNAAAETLAHELAHFSREHKKRCKRSQEPPLQTWRSLVGSGTDSARSTSQESEGQTTSQEQAVAKSVSGIDQHGQQFRVQADGLPATVTVHYDHICLEYLSSPTRLSASDTEEAKKREVSFATMRSWRSNANSVEIELGESESLLMTCDGNAAAETLAHELAHFSRCAHAFATAAAAKRDLESSMSEKTQLQDQIAELQANLRKAQGTQLVQTDAVQEAHTSLHKRGNENLVAALAEAEARVQEERLASAKIAQELKTVRAAYVDTLAEMDQVTKQYAAELAKRTSTILEREATIALLQEQDDSVGAADQQPPREADSLQEAEQLRAQIVSMEAEVANNIAKAKEAEAKCASLTENLAAAEEQINSLRQQPAQTALDVSTELVEVKAALAAQAKARKAEQDAYLSTLATKEIELKALSAEHQVEVQREIQRNHHLQRTIQSLQSAVSISQEVISIPEDVDALMDASKAEQVHLEAAVEAVSADAETKHRAFVQMQQAHRVMVQEHSDANECFDAELSQWLELSSQAEQQHRSEAVTSTALMLEVNKWLALSRQAKGQHPENQQQAVINKLRADFADLQVDHEMEIAKLERQVGAQARELSSAAEKIMRAEAAREEAENVAMGLAEGLDDKSVASASRSSSQMEEETAVEVQKLHSELNMAKDERAGLKDQSPRQDALAIEITELKARLLDTTSQLETITLQQTAAQEELQKIKGATSADSAFAGENLDDARTTENKLSKATAEVKQLEHHLHSTSKELEAVRGRYADAERRRQEETRDANTKAENKAMIADIFGFCDATGSGVLQQDEYKLYLEGIGAWGTPPRVDDKFDAQWIVECTQMGCDHEVGITWEAFEGHFYGRYSEDLSKEGSQHIEEHLIGVKRAFRAKLAEIQQDNVEMRDSIKAMLAQHRSQSQADKQETDVERTRRLTAEAEAKRLGQHWMDAELTRVVELGIVEAVCEAETDKKAKVTSHAARQEAARHATERLKLQETLAATRQELSAMMQERSAAEAAADGLQKRLQEYESGLSAESKTRRNAEAAVDAHVATIEALTEDLAATRAELAATIEAARAEQATAAAKLASKQAELAVAMVKAEGELGVVATERNAALQTISLHEQRLAEKEADFARAAQEEVAALHTKLKLSDQRLDRVSRHTATLVEKARAEEKAAWMHEKGTLTTRMKAQEMEMDRVLTVRLSALQEQIVSTVAEVETRAIGVELALRERLEQEESSSKAAQAGADADIARLTRLLETAERTLQDRLPTLEGALSNAEREAHAARVAHATDKAEVLDQHAAAIAAVEQAKATLHQESTEKISTVMAQASESTASMLSEMALKTSQWDDDRKRMTAQLDTVSSKLDALQVEYDKEIAAHKKCQLLLADKEKIVASQEEATKHLGMLLRKAIDEKTASSAALAEKTAAWTSLKSDLIRDRDMALKECDGLIKRLKQQHAKQIAEVNTRTREEISIAKVEQDGLRVKLGQKELGHSKVVADLEATVRTLVHERDMACAELQRRNSSFSKERQKLIAERDASRMQADEAEVSSALAAQQLYDIGTELSTERIESRRAEDALRTEMLQSEHRLRSLLVDSERKKQKWAADATWLESSTDHIQQESARRVADAELRAAGAETKLFDFIGKSAALLSGKGALSAIDDTKNRRKQEQGGLWVFIQEDGAADSDPDERVRSPLPEVTPREIPLHVEALEELDEGVPPEIGASARSDGGPVALRDYSYSYNVGSSSKPLAAGAAGGMSPESPGIAAPYRPHSVDDDPTREDAL